MVGTAAGAMAPHRANSPPMAHHQKHSRTDRRSPRSWKSLGAWPRCPPPGGLRGADHPSAGPCPAERTSPAGRGGAATSRPQPHEGWHPPPLV